ERSCFELRHAFLSDRTRESNPIGAVGFQRVGSCWIETKQLNRTSLLLHLDRELIQGSTWSVHSDIERSALADDAGRIDRDRGRCGASAHEIRRAEARTRQ